MTDYMAAMLDELMGSGRNAQPGAKVNTDFDTPEVCKDFLVGFCPNELFRNTKNDMGFCPLKHDNGLKNKYETSSRRGKLGYEERFLEKISELDRDVRRKIDKNEKRLTITQGNGGEEGFQALKEKQEEKKLELEKKYMEKMEEAEQAGATGNVNLAQTLVTEADKLKEEKEACEEEGKRLLERFYHLEDVANSLNKPMKVCQTCGCFMLVNDAQSRIDDHFAGKLHIAYATIREKIEAMNKELEERRKSRMGGGDAEKRDKERERDRRVMDRRASRGGSDRDKERDSKDRKERKRSRSRSRDRKGDRARSERSSDRDRRDRDRDRDRRRH